MKKHNKLIAIVFAALLLCMTIVGCNQSQTDIQNYPSAGSEVQEVTVVNEQELRQQLAKEDANLVIHTSGNMEIREGFIVNGTKTLTGDSEIKFALGAELGHSILSVSTSSALTLDGPILHCNYNADGIFVDAGGTLTCLSGQINYAGAYGILTYGDVTVEDLSISDCEFIAICAQMGSHVDVKGGSIQRSSSNDIYIVDGAQVNISGKPVMEGALEHAIINYGSLHIGGGKFGNVNNYLCDNYGELTVAYEGEEENGVVEFYGARNSIFLVRRGATASFSDVYIHDTQRQGIASLGGETTISNCKFENTGSHSIDIQGGNATVEHIVITNSKGSGMEASNSAKVNVSDFTVNSCKNIGIASRGATITATDITITNTGKYGLTCGNTKLSSGMFTVKNATITKTANHGIYVYQQGVANMENVAVSEGKSRGIYVAATASCTITGDSSFKNMGKGGVEARGKLTLDSVTICDNHVENSGAGAYVADGGELTLIGGAIYGNSSAVRGGGICVSDATVTIKGTEIYNNSAVNHGGGMYVQKTSLVSLKSGKITKNTSDANGDGIYILSAESQVKVAEDFYLGGNDIKVDNAGAYVKFTGSSMKYHSESDPVLLTPNYNAPEGTVLALCDSESNAKNIAVASGDGSYDVIRSGRKFVTRFAIADMDMTGADTVSVYNFAQLKSAVESTTSKRNIILKADIAFTERIRLPGGVNINIQDDGTKRTLTRAGGFTDSFFVTHYGTGLYLTGTAENMLVLDGSGAAGAKNQSLIRAAGSTRIENVKLCNNGSSLKEHDVRGALVRQIYGDIKLCNSVLSGGTAYAGGALLLENSTGYAENCLFTGNESTIGGGAIRVNATCRMELVSSQITDNHAGSTGGGIVAVGAANVTATNTTFQNNTASSYGGAVSAQDADTQICLIGTDDRAVFQNNSSLTAGAVYAVKGASLEISGYTFDANTATGGTAGAISVLDHSSATITDTSFYNNTASASAGALSVSGSTANLINCEFGKEGAGNTAADKAGAILVTDGATVEMDVTGDAAGSVSYNTASGEYGGGAVYVNTDSKLIAKGYVFESNQAVSGGALYLAAGAQVSSEANQFISNAANSKNGGAVYCAGIYEDTNSSYLLNEAVRNGGAIIVMSGGELTMTATDAVMQGNQADVNHGGAVFVNGGGKATITSYALQDNTSGGIQVQSGATATIDSLTFAGSGNTVTVNGSLTLQSLTNAQINQAKDGAVITLSGNAGTNVSVKPYSYTEGKVVLTNTTAELVSTITLVQPEGADSWSIDRSGKLVVLIPEPTVATITVDGATVEFATVQAAVEYANANGSTETMEIILLENVAINATLEIQKNIAIVNNSGATVTISRGAELAGDMFTVIEGAALTLGSENAGALIIDGTSEAAISGRTVTAASGASFTLNKNAALQNANSTATGGALQTAGTTKLYGTIQNNKSVKDGAGVEVISGTVTIDGAAFTGNTGGSSCGGAALSIKSGASVDCQNATFTNNTVPGTKNGGAIYVAGTFTDHGSIYTGNQARNGGAIFLGADTAVVTLTGDADAAFTNNNALTANGGAIYVNGGTLTVNGYTFEGNTASSNADSVIHVAKGSATVDNAVFQGDAAQSIYAATALTAQNLTGTQIVQATSGAAITLSGNAGTNVSVKPHSYTSGHVVLTNTSAELIATISLVQPDNGAYWSIDAAGKLTTAVAGITIGEETSYYSTLEAAIAAANAAEGTATIVVIQNMSIGETLTIEKNVTLVNASGEEITISRGAELAGDMFTVIEGAALTLGSENAGALIIDGTSEAAISGRTVTVASGASFTLNKNAALQNANSTATGGALQTAGTTKLYGTIQNNKSVKDGAGVEVIGGTVTIDGAIFTGNTGGSSCSGAALCIRSGAAVDCQNATFTSNNVPTSKNGGAIYCAGKFTDKNSTYIDNQAKNGGAIFTAAGADAVVEYAVFTSNKVSVNGAAIYANGGTITIRNSTCTGNTKINGSAATTLKKGNGTLYIGVKVFVDENEQTVTEPTTE